MRLKVYLKELLFQNQLLKVLIFTRLVYMVKANRQMGYLFTILTME
uniref:Uncharacterized protein n=1 Tax=Siphoviridae sp. ct2vX3 TaxID=2825318 RepID=A0A8S5PYB2_9CAUD|nr:MAG TPA: hypothetical protein [Siphoviridae sp. ct2vX3]